MAAKGSIWSKIRRAFEREGFSGGLRFVLGGIGRRIYCEFFILTPYIDLAEWQGKFLRRAHDLKLVELGLEELPSFERLLPAEKRQVIIEGLKEGWQIFATFKDGEIVGTVGTRSWDSLCGLSYRAQEGERIIHHLYVRPKFRRTAAGGAVGDMALGALKAKGYRRVWGGLIHSTKAPSLAFCRNLGLRQHAKHRVRRLFGVFHFGHRQVEGARDRLPRAPRER